MLLSDWYYERREKRIRAAEAAAKAALVGKAGGIDLRVIVRRGIMQTEKNVFGQPKRQPKREKR